MFSLEYTKALVFRVWKL